VDLTKLDAPTDAYFIWLANLLTMTMSATIRTHWYADDLLKLCPSKGDKYVIDEELQHTDHLFLEVACFTFLNFV
jgi:hypothetical protein